MPADCCIKLAFVYELKRNCRESNMIFEIKNDWVWLHASGAKTWLARLTSPITSLAPFLIKNRLIASNFRCGAWNIKVSVKITRLTINRIFFFLHTRRFYVAIKDSRGSEIMRACDRMQRFAVLVEDSLCKILYHSERYTSAWRGFRAQYFVFNDTVSNANGEFAI